MALIHIPPEIPVRFLERSQRGNRLALGLIGVGVLAFVAALVTDAHTAWISWVANWLFFTSVAIGAVAFAVATTIVKAQWNWSVRRISLAFAAYLPFAFLTLLPMLGLREDYFPWIEEIGDGPDPPGKAGLPERPVPGRAEPGRRRRALRARALRRVSRSASGPGHDARGRGWRCRTRALAATR